MYWSPLVGQCLQTTPVNHLYSVLESAITVAAQSSKMYRTLSSSHILATLKLYCDENGLIVNTLKTKILACRASGRMSRKPYSFFYKGQKIEIVKSCMYLGIPFTTSTAGTMATDMAVKKAKIASNVVLNTLSKLKSDTWNSKIKIFNSMVKSTLTYQAHIWGLNQNLLDKLESAHLYFFKRLFSLPKCTPNYALRLELGLEHILVQVIKNACRWIIRVLKMPDSRLPKICLLRLCESQSYSEEKFNWLLRLRALLKPINEDSMLDNLSLSVWLNRTEIIVNKYKLYCRQLDANRYAQSSILQLTRTSLWPPARLLHICPHNLAKSKIQLRLACTLAFNISINRTIYRFKPDKICTQCHRFQEETVIHLLAECPCYERLRLKYLQQWIIDEDNYNLLTILEEDSLNSTKALFSFLTDVVKLRNNNSSPLNT
ncbi:Protein of unknown function [Cotesia congregata]|uniref:Uncharacterized protein n=1 Tax=Cotesia congregata TaxID=51543 RepID=A0A8J2ML58_COTCN|nr:Protein of unknown function [Cotesia congregata]